MSILIKGMEMPTSCDNCWALDDYGDYPRCRITEEQRGYNFPIREKRMDNCPLSPVPPHGDLIDRDALEMERRAENAQKGWHDSFAVIFNGGPYYEAVYDCTEQFKELVNNAPTIIPAEEE